MTAPKVREPRERMGYTAIAVATVTPSAEAFGAGPRLCNIIELFFAEPKNLDPVDLKAKMTTKWMVEFAKSLSRAKRGDIKIIDNLSVVRVLVLEPALGQQ